jgi:hypothetical protein
MQITSPEIIGGKFEVKRCVDRERIPIPGLMCPYAHHLETLG